MLKFYVSVMGAARHVRPYNLLQIRYGTQWDVASIGCTGCIKINFADGVVLFLADHYGVILIY